MPITHTFVSPKSDGSDATNIQPSNWNADHTIDFLGKVVMTHDNENGDNNSWYVNKPDGTSIDISASSTSGLQEAIDFAATYGYWLDVRGGAAISNSSSVIECTTPIVFPAIQNLQIRLNGVTINFSSAIGSQTCITFNSLMMMDIDFGSTQIVNAGTGITVLFKAEDPLAVDGHTVITSSYIKLHSIANIHTPTSDTDNVPAVKFDISAHAIDDNTIIITEILGSGAGIVVSDSPGGTTAVFRGNYIRCMNLHDQTGTDLPVVQIGQTAPSDPVDYQVLENIWDLSIQVNTSSKKGISTFGSFDQFRVNVIEIAATTGIAFTFGSTANYNILMAGRLQGAVGTNTLTTVSVDGTQNHNKVTCQHDKANTAITLTGSPFVLRNTDFFPWKVTFNGGTYTDVAISVDGVTYSSMGVAVFIIVDPGEYFKLTYTVGPTVRKIF